MGDIYVIAHAFADQLITFRRRFAPVVRGSRRPVRGSIAPPNRDAKITDKSRTGAWG
jgi:hypothetical protein